MKLNIYVKLYLSIKNEIFILCMSFVALLSKFTKMAVVMNKPKNSFKNNSFGMQDYSGLFYFFREYLKIQNVKIS